jgi:tetratricopeptide (TPR) repeat protein
MTAIILGRFLEMMVGVARISDLTVLWAIFAMFVATAGIDNNGQVAANSAQSDSQSPAPMGRRARRRAARDSIAPSFRVGLFVRLAILAWVVGGISVITWQKSVNSVRASVAEGRALKHFSQDDLEGAIEDLGKAIQLAPGVPLYYNNRAQIFFLYMIRPDQFIEPNCARQTELPYLGCLGLESLESNLDSIDQQPFYYRAHIAAGNASFNINAHETAIKRYAAAAALVPNSWGIRNNLAESQIALGLNEEALGQLERSIQITGDTDNSIPALNFKANALRNLGQLDEAADVLGHAVSLGRRQASLDLLRGINSDLKISGDIGYFDGLIEENPNDIGAFYFRGLANLVQGNPKSAMSDLETSLSLGLNLNEVKGNLLYSRFKSGEVERADVQFYAVTESVPVNPLFSVFFSEFRLSSEQYHLALRLLDKADSLDPNSGFSQLVRTQVFMALGLEDSAKDILGYSAETELPTAQHFADRGIIHAYFNQRDLAFSDLNRAISINPNKPDFYVSRAKVFANANDLASAIIDLSTAINSSPSDGRLFMDRGILNHIAGESRNSAADFGLARSLGESIIPPLEDRNISYFAYFETDRFLENNPFETGPATYTDMIPTEAKARRQLSHQRTTRIQNEITAFSKVGPDQSAYVESLASLVSLYLELGSWNEAVETSAQLIGLSPNTSESYRLRGSAYIALNKHQEALEDLNRAILLDPGNSENFVSRAAAFSEMGEFDSALADLVEAIRLEPNSSNAFKLIGFLSVQSGKPSTAFADINHAIELSPFNHNAYLKRAKAHVAVGQLSLALEDMDRAIALAPTNAEYLQHRGSVYFESAEYDLALADFDSAIAVVKDMSPIGPEYAKSFTERGKSYLRLGNFNLASSDAGSAIEILEDEINTPEWERFRSVINQRLADAHELLGNVFTGLGRDADAREERRIASRLR